MLLLELLVFAAIIFVLLLEIALAVFFIGFKALLVFIKKAWIEGPPYPEKENEDETAI